MCELCLDLVQLRLAGRQLDLTLVELGRARRCLTDDCCLVGVVTFECLELAAQPLLLQQQLGLALAEGLVFCCDPRALLLEVSLTR